MKNQYGFRKLNILILSLMAFAVFSVQAKPNDRINASLKIDQYRNAIVQKLTDKLRVDLSDNNVEVKLNDLQNSEISKSRIDFDGKALAVVKTDKTELPFQFNAKVNLTNQSVEDINYTFIEAAPEFEPSTVEGSLMKELMMQISKDYKTTNIVIAIDNFDAAKLTSNETKYEGFGEVRIGDFEWRKVKFNVVFDSQNQTATKILYDVQK
jgi:dipeptidyl aminopeptidase/acylaminoacyl peptidase